MALFRKSPATSSWTENSAVVAGDDIASVDGAVIAHRKWGDPVGQGDTRRESQKQKERNTGKKIQIELSQAQHVRYADVFADFFADFCTKKCQKMLTETDTASREF